MSDLPEPVSREEIGRRFKEAREAIDLGQREAGRLAGMAQMRIYEIEAGKYRPSFEKVIFLVQALGLDPKIIVPEFFRKSAKKPKSGVED